MKFCRLLFFVLASTLLAGCASRFVNLTPRTIESPATGLYRFEVQWDTSRRGANNADVRGYVMIDETLYPLSRMSPTQDRWEVTLPIPSDKPVISYRYKFDYTYPTLSSRVAQSDLSLPYFLELRPGGAAGSSTAP